MNRRQKIKIFLSVKSNLVNTDFNKRIVLAGMVASSLPLLFCAFIFLPSVQEIFSARSSGSFAELFEDSYSIRALVYCIAYPLIYSLFMWFAICFLRTERVIAALIAGWLPLALSFFALAYSWI